MNDETIRSWTADELIRNTYHELNQRSNIALGFVRLLGDETHFKPVSDKQREVLSLLQFEVEGICEVANWMRIWVSTKR